VRRDRGGPAAYLIGRRDGRMGCDHANGPAAGRQGGIYGKTKWGKQAVAVELGEYFYKWAQSRVRKPSVPL
jgi:hypothetical protein